MLTMNAYEQLGKMTNKEKISERFFYALIIYFRESFLDEIDFRVRLQNHRKPFEFLSEIRQGLFEDIRLIQQRSEMTDIEGNRHGYAPTKIVELWKADKRLGNLYYATEKYCHMRHKDFNTIAIHITEYRAINKLASRINRLILQSTQFAR